MYSHQLLSRFILGAVVVWMTTSSALAQDRAVSKKTDREQALGYSAAISSRKSHSFPDEVLQYDGSLETFQLLPGQDPEKDYVDPAMLTLDNGDILLAFREWGFPTPIQQLQEQYGCDSPQAEWFQWKASDDRPPRLWLTRTTDGGGTWSEPQLIAEDRVFTGSFYNISMVQTESGRVLISDSPVEAAYTEDPDLLRPNLFYSDDEGASWSDTTLSNLPGIDVLVGPVDGRVWRPYTDEEDGSVRYFSSTDGISWSDSPGTMVPNQDTTTVFHLQGLTWVNGSEYLAAMRQEDLETGESALRLGRSVDSGSTWTLEEPYGEAYAGSVKRSPGGTLYYIYQEEPLEWGQLFTVGIPEVDVYYTTSEDGGHEWSQPEPLTNHAGGDFFADFAFSEEKPLVAFNSTRFLPTPWSNLIDGSGFPRGARSGMIWIGIPGQTQEAPSIMPPVVRFVRADFFWLHPDDTLTAWVEAFDESELASVTLHYSAGGEEPVDFAMRDDGLGPDSEPGDGRWTARGMGPVGWDPLVLSATATDVDGNQSHSYGYFRGTFWTVAVEEAPVLQFSTAAGRLGMEYYYQHPGNNPCDPGLAAPLSHLWLTGGGGIHAGLERFWLNEAGDIHLGFGWTGLGLDTLAGVEGPFFQFTWVPGTTRPEAGPGISDYDVTLYGEIVDFGIQTVYRAFQWADDQRDDFIIIEYTYINSGTVGDLQNLYAGLSLDIDLNSPRNLSEEDLASSALDDQAGFDAENHVLYAFDSGDYCQSVGEDCPDTHLGMALLGDDPNLYTATAWGWHAQPDYSDPEWIVFNVENLSSGIREAGGVDLPVNDYLLLIAPEPFDLRAQLDTVAVAYGIVVGGSKEEMLTNLDMMRKTYAEDVPKLGTALEPSAELPSAFELDQNYPNPFNPTTTISFDVPHPGYVSLKIFDLLGREVDNVVSSTLTAGRHRYTWNASDASSGVYIYRLEADGFVGTRMLTVLR